MTQMIAVNTAISRIRRDLTLLKVIKLLFIVLFVGSLFLPLAQTQIDAVWAITILGTIWLVLNVRSAQGARLAAASPSLIASGQFEEAEEKINEVLSRFSFSKSAKLLSLHHLAVLRHAQKRWQDSALLSRALLGHRLGPALATLNKPARLMLADSLLELDDAVGARDAIAGLANQRMSLVEMMNLLSVQLDVQSRLGAWDEMLQNVMPKVQLAEIMSSDSAARAQAMLALAARKKGRSDLSDWLRQRAELLADANSLASARPVWGLWQRDPVAENYA